MSDCGDCNYDGGDCGNCDCGDCNDCGDCGDCNCGDCCDDCCSTIGEWCLWDGEWALLKNKFRIRKIFVYCLILACVAYSDSTSDDCCCCCRKEKKKVTPEEDVTLEPIQEQPKFLADIEKVCFPCIYTWFFFSNYKVVTQFLTYIVLIFFPTIFSFLVSYYSLLVPLLLLSDFHPSSYSFLSVYNSSKLFLFL